MNDNIITQDYDSLYAHFNKFRTSGYLLAEQLPLEEVVIAQSGSSGEKKCVAKYKILKTLPGQNSQAIKIMAIWDIDQDNRFRQMNEVVHFEH